MNDTHYENVTRVTRRRLFGSAGMGIGSVALAALLEHGAWCSFGSAMPVSAELRALAAATPPERILSETDNPGAAQWALGRVGMPGELDAVIAALGDVHGLSADAMAAIIRDNWRRLTAGDARLAPWRALLD